MRDEGRISGGDQEAAPVGVLLFHPADVFGGAERTSLNLVRWARRDRVRFVVVGDPNVFSLPDDVHLYSLSDLGVNNGFAGFRRALADAAAVLRIARKENCRIVLGMLHYGALVAALVRLVSLFQLKTISSPRTPSVLGIEFHVGSSGPQVIRWRRMVAVFCRLANHLVVASAGLKRECVEVFGARAERVTVIPNGIDAEILDRVAATPPTSPDKRAFRIVTSGRMAPEKDIDTLLLAFAQFYRIAPVELWIIGDGPERARLEALAETLGIAKYAKFLGFQPNPFSYLKGADVFVHTSRFEGFGNVLLEAMACGVPVVATDCDFGPREIIQPGINGLLVAPSSPDELVRALRSLLDQPELRQRFVAAGRATLAQYEVKTMVQRYEQVILGL